MNYLIGSGYYAEPSLQKDDSFETAWYENTVKYARGAVVIINVGIMPFPIGGITPQVVRLPGNLGHIDDLVVTKAKPHKFCGWSGAMLALAWLAYCNESDFIYKEQDCLAFGPWVERMYDEAGDAPVIHGNCKIQPAAQSLFLVKHAYIPEFTRLYLSAGADNDETNLPEMKFARLGKEHGWKTFSFGYDRDRPFNVKDEVFYLQQITAEEMAVLQAEGLI